MGFNLPPGLYTLIYGLIFLPKHPWSRPSDGLQQVRTDLKKTKKSAERSRFTITDHFLFLAKRVCHRWEFSRLVSNVFRAPLYKGTRQDYRLIFILSPNDFYPFSPPITSLYPSSRSPGMFADNGIDLTPLMGPIYWGKTILPSVIPRLTLS
jgi:hypothetical protein